MPFDHNDHYHRLLLRKLPPHGRTALDIGCGTGRFARLLAARGYEVDALDPSAEVIAEARALGGEGNPRFRGADVTEEELPEGHYDAITCLASLHHMPFGTVTRLRAALAPGGTLLVLGCYAEGRGGTPWRPPPTPWRGWRCTRASACAASTGRRSGRPSRSRT
ncbi:Ubiquinone biosynthesis O-methyltransferase, mitochondrial [Streptomyces alboniger]